MEPWLRVSQELFEAWLKNLSESNPLIDFRTGWLVSEAQELDDGAEVKCSHIETGDQVTIQADFIIGCDGAHSMLRKSLGIQLDGGPL